MHFRTSTLGVYRGAILHSTAELREILARTGWWTDPHGWIRRDPDLRRAREAPFDYNAGVLEGLVPGGLYVLRGPRRVGKSVEIKKTVRGLIERGEDPRRIIHIAADELEAADLRRVVDAADAITPASERRFWFFDEITAIPDGWPAAIKWLRDNDLRFGTDTVVLTGSSARDLTEAIKALAGRRGGAVDSDRVLLPMSFRSFLRASRAAGGNEDGPPPSHKEPISVAELSPDVLAESARELAPWMPYLVREWETYLAVGGFPQAVAAHAAVAPPATEPGRGEAVRALKESLLDVIRGEAFGQSAWSRAHTDAFMRRLAAGIGSPTNCSDIASDTGTSANTVRRRIDTLRENFVVWPCYREHRLVPALRAQEKTYFTDPIFTALSPRPRRRIDVSLLSEQQLGMTLVRAFLRRDAGGYPNFDAVLHHRTRSRKEIDFAGPGFGGLAIESKYVDGDRWKRAAPTLKASPWRGLVATRAALDMNDPDLSAVPTALLAWLLGG
ncbi:MAG: ATP-binding protein [Gemmatimonadales bacterium]|nr:ATP-binding protein [Gemmatimonadales bacterium]MXX78924.1 ATP-binding protein [Gemmatimonadales bacterium]MYC89586.1 ATP-binding protein [Candidatus Palauibacter denitrificans]